MSPRERYLDLEASAWGTGGPTSDPGRRLGRLLENEPRDVAEAGAAITRERNDVMMKALDGDAAAQAEWDAIRADLRRREAPFRDADDVNAACDRAVAAMVEMGSTSRVIASLPDAAQKDPHAKE